MNMCALKSFIPHVREAPVYEGMKSYFVNLLDANAYIYECRSIWITIVIVLVPKCLSESI